MLPRFAALDFETANRYAGSACALGIVVANREQILEEFYTLIRPRELRFEYWNTRIHGICAEQVRDQPEFPDLWTKVQGLLDGTVCVAHNAAFDMRVLRHLLGDYQMSVPELSYACTHIAARRTWPGLASYKLSRLGSHFGIEFNHHHALEDARVCALIMQRILQHHGASCVTELQSSCAKLARTKYVPRRAVNSDDVDVRTILPTTTEFDPSHPFFGKRFVFTGRLSSLPRGSAAQLVVNCGGTCQAAVTEETDFLVCGRPDLRMIRTGTVSSKVRKASEYAQRGLPITRLSEERFLEMYGRIIEQELRRQSSF